MSLSPIDVQQKTFGTALRGYDLDEVDDFLDEVVTSLREYEQKLEAAHERIAELESSLASKGDDASTISKALLAAQKAADGMIEEARIEADKILADAHDEAGRLTDERDEEQARVQTEIDRMRSALTDVRTRLGELISAVGPEFVAMEEIMDEAESATLEPSTEVEFGAEEGAEESEIPESETESEIVESVEVDEVIEPGDGEEAGEIGETLESETVETVETIETEVVELGGEAGETHEATLDEHDVESGDDRDDEESGSDSRPW